MKTLSQNNSDKLKSNGFSEENKHKVDAKTLFSRNKEYLLKTILEKNYGHLYNIKKAEK